MLLKIILTLWTCILIPVYAQNYGLQNFLWLSDIGLFGTVLALWLESRFLMSVITLAVLPGELAWQIDFFAQLITGSAITGVSTYMFQIHYSLFLRSLSLFHLIMPYIWIWYIYQWGYTPQALPYAICLSWAVLLATYFFTKAQANINFVFSPEKNNWQWISPLGWLLALLVISALMCFLLHKVLLLLTGQKILF